MKWDDVLRQACEVVGLDCAPGGPWIAGGRRVDWEHPMLPAYVAELLMEKCDRGSVSGPLFALMSDEPGIISFKADGAWAQSPSALGAWAWELSTLRIRILAAMVALGELTLEQAREVE